jgi:integrase/recombinase XerD
MAEDGASAPMLMTKSRHRAITSLARYARPGVEALQRWEAERDPARRRRHRPRPPATAIDQNPGDAGTW